MIRLPTAVLKREKVSRRVANHAAKRHSRYRYFTKILRRPAFA